MDEAPQPSAATGPSSAPRRRLWLLAGLAPLLLVLLLGVVGYGLLRSESATGWLLRQAPGVQVDGARGTWLGDTLGFERLRIQIAGGVLTIEGLELQNPRWAWRPATSAWVGLTVDRVQARSVSWRSGAPGAPPVAPQSLVLPLRLRIAALAVERLQIDEQPPLTALRAALELGAEGGSRHRIDGLAFDWDRTHVEGSAHIGSAAPLDLDAQARFGPAGAAPVPWGAALKARGPLAGFALNGVLRAAPAAGRPMAALDLQAAIAPFAAWPLSSLQASTQALDLATLASGAPQTRLSGRITVTSTASTAPIGADLQFENALPGRWDEGRLPLRRLAFSAVSSLAQRDRVELSAIELQLADARGDAGRWRGSGLWLGTDLNLETTLDAVTPQRLDARAAAMRLSGPLKLALGGLPSPDPSAAAGNGVRTLALEGRLEGRLDGAALPVQLQFELGADAAGVELRRLRAASGSALAELQASAVRVAGGGWRLRSAGTLTEFDPLPWWPGDAGSPWRQGPHRLSGAWQLDLRLPADAGTLSLPVLLQRIAGSGELRLSDSVLAGVPLQGRLVLEQTPKDSAPSRLRGELRLADNRFTLEGQGDPQGPGSGDRWAFSAQAPALGALAPLVRLLPGAAAWAPRQGRAEATVTATGRWPALASQGRIALSGLQLERQGVERAEASWTFDTASERPLALTLDASGLRSGSQRAERLHAELRGTARQHAIVIETALPLQPPALLAQLLDLSASGGTQARLQGEGSWQRQTGGSARWSGQVTRLDVRPWDGRSAPGGDSRWLAASGLRAELVFDAEGQLERLDAAAGRLRLADAVALRWDAFSIDPRGAAARFELRADIEPVQVAPLLARMQPTLGWRGDLQLGARIAVTAGERFDAEVVVERSAGDLVVEDELGTQPLGLSSLRFALSAHDGLWVFSHAFAGRSVGESSGSLRARSTPERRWPHAEAPIDGAIELHVANLGVWGSWLPPGWRLAGDLRGGASFGGSFGAPEYRGALRGSGLGVRNILQGVNLGPGELSVVLQGTSASIETFSLRGGDGLLKISGGAEFGNAPSARLSLLAERFRLLSRVDRQLTASGNAELLLRAEGLKLDGKLRVDEGLFDASGGDAPSLDDDVSVRSALPAGTVAPEAPPRVQRSSVVAVAIDLGERLRVRGRGLDTLLGGQLQLSTPGGRLAVRGAVNAERGSYAAYGQKLDIARGVLSFNGPVDDVRLDILALRPNLDIEVGVAVTGSVTAPRVRLHSVPDMSDTDKLSWLVLGRAPDELGRADTALLQRAAMALLAGEGETPTDQLMRNLGIDELSLRQSDGEVRDTVISLGKQLSRRWYVGYERGVNATTGTWQLIYRLAQRFTLRAQSGLENALDVIWVWRVGEPDAPPAKP